MKIIAQRSEDTQWGLHPNLDVSGRTLAKMTAEVILKGRKRSNGEDAPSRAIPGKGGIFLQAEDSLLRTEKQCSLGSLTFGPR